MLLKLKCPREGGRLKESTENVNCAVQVPTSGSAH